MNVIRHFFRKGKEPATPREQYGAIFDVVQLSHTFKDSKTFVDMVPRGSSRKILKDYYKNYGTQLDIARFVRDHFTMPGVISYPGTLREGEPVSERVRTYIERMWGTLQREKDHPDAYSSLLALPYSYIVPGGRFREIYYWDSYFTMLGLRESGKVELMENMVRNFAFLIDRYGFIPNGNRSYYLTRSQPPVFALMVSLLAEVRGEGVFDEFSRHIAKEYAYWMHGQKDSAFAKGESKASEHVVRMPGGELLNRYWDASIAPREEGFVEDIEVGRHVEDPAVFYRNMRAGAESGWDFSSRWFEDGKGLESIRTTDLVPVDLNVILYMTEEILAREYERQKKHKLAVKFGMLAERRAEAIRTYCWDEAAGWFDDYLLREKKRSGKPTMAGVFPLFAGIATPAQAGKIIKTLEAKFLRQGGVVTTLERSGQQWDAPNGWAPLQYVAVQGLERYGAHKLAYEIAIRWCTLNMSVYEKTGLLLEKYNVEDAESFAAGGEYELQDGFGWTNGVLLALLNKYHISDELSLATKALREEAKHQVTARA